MPPPSWVRLASCLSVVLVAASANAADPPAKPDYVRDVRPLLSNHCFKCHGPATQKGKLRLDAHTFAVKNSVVVPGKPADSTLIERVTSDADDERMPPKDAGGRLTPAQIDILKRWIANGAEYAPHWAFVPPKKSQIPSTKFQGKNEIDAFVFARLEKAGLTPSPEADRGTLIRRVSLDLTGLLPTPAEVDAFVKDLSPDAYEKLVDRLLASPHYGERQARHWLDLARYADSNGYTIDGARSIWPYRDWVINALNADTPFDRFTIEQLAGDLLPKATKDQQIATGFHRNTSFNEEGGTDPEQFRVERTVDRTNTTGAVWLGLTVGCAQCHDHKYDPVSQKDYYRLYAFFDSADEPTITLGGPPAIEKQIAEMNAKLAELRKGGNDEAVKKLLAELKAVEKKVPSTLVMRERKTPRETFVQIRGDFLRKGDRVEPAYPTALASTAATPKSRLDLAKWLVSAENPLTARVVVNRHWQQFFGVGLVETENDFGMQGTLPTHPELLDWLAVEFRERGWSIKHLHRLMVTSATYRQSSRMRSAEFGTRNPEDRSRHATVFGFGAFIPHSAFRTPHSVDPQNKLLARQNRVRLDAEIIRDAALSASGLLAPKVGGPGVYPPLPAEVFAFTQSKHPWPESKGPDRFRRGMYTHIWRQSQHHLLTTFDAADAQTTCTKRNRSNTPLQALHLANDPAFVEFAEGLGKQVVKDGPKDDAGRIDYAYRLCFARTPTDAERARVRKYLDAQTNADPKTAWTMTARVLMNLDEFITRE